MPSTRRSFLAALSAAALAPAAARASVRVEGVTFESRIVLAGQALLLNGTGVRAVAWLKGYVAALYLEGHASTPEQVLALPGAKRLRLHMLLEAPVVEFVKAIHKGIGRNSPADMQPALAERIERFDRQILPVGNVRKGDTVDLDYLPQTGFACAYNGRSLGPSIPGDDFYDALLGIFIGPLPVDRALKAGLLGGAGA